MLSTMPNSKSHFHIAATGGDQVSDSVGLLGDESGGLRVAQRICQPALERAEWISTGSDSDSRFVAAGTLSLSRVAVRSGTARFLIAVEA